MVRGPALAGDSLAGGSPAAGLLRFDADLRGVADVAGPSAAADERAPAAVRRDADGEGCLLDTGSFLAERARHAQVVQAILGSCLHAGQPRFTLNRQALSGLPPRL